MSVKDRSKAKNNQELVKDSIDALVKSLEVGHSDVLSSYLTAMAQILVGRLMLLEILVDTSDFVSPTLTRYSKTSARILPEHPLGVSTCRNAARVAATSLTVTG